MGLGEPKLKRVVGRDSGEAVGTEKWSAVVLLHSDQIDEANRSWRLQLVGQRLGKERNGRDKETETRTEMETGHWKDGCSERSSFFSLRKGREIAAA